MNEDHHPVGRLSGEGAAELLPCPFCGNIDRLEVVPFDAEPYFPGFIVRCNASGFDGDPRKGCGCNTGWAETEAEAVDAWNRRAPDRALLDRIEELEAAVAPFAAVGDIFEVRAGNRPNEDDDPITEWTDHRVGSRLITVGDFRRARKALSGEKQ